MRIIIIKMADNEMELLPLPGSKSAVWAYFGFPAKDGHFLVQDKKKRNEVVCKNCKKQFAYTGSTTNLISHLCNNHSKDHTALVEQQKGESSQSQQSSSKSIDPLPPDIRDTLTAHLPLAHASKRWNKLTESVCYNIAKDMLPLDTVSGEGFLSMLKAFEPRYTPPGTKAV